jgi:hypothetical protein
MYQAVLTQVLRVLKNAEKSKAPATREEEEGGQSQSTKDCDGALHLLHTNSYKQEFT